MLVLASEGRVLPARTLLAFGADGAECDITTASMSAIIAEVFRLRLNHSARAKLLAFLAFAVCSVLDFVRGRSDSSGEILAYMSEAAA